MRKQGSLLVVLIAACVALFAACAPAPVPVTTTTTSTTTTTTTIPDAPIAGDDTRTTEFNTAVTDGTTRDNDSGTAPLTTNLVTDTTNGTLVLATDGTYTYTPTPDFSGTDTFTYTVTDNYSQTSNTATVTITINPLGAISISAGGGHSCAVMTDHTARCWGSNQPLYFLTISSGRLGNNSDIDSSVPVTVLERTSFRVRPLGGIASISAGTFHTCAVMIDHTARCWGDNAFGQLGNNTEINSSVAVTVVDPANTTKALKGIASITAGPNHTCALMTDGTARCWGINYVGQLGNNSPTGLDSQNLPFGSLVAVTVVDPADTTKALRGIASISVDAGSQMCAVMTDSTARCWGYNGNGQLGNGTNINSSVPVTVVNPANTSQALSGIASITSEGSFNGGSHTCALMTDSTARCWGYNGNGQLGNGTNINSSVPVTVVDPADTAQALSGIASISVGGGNHTCAVMTDSTARCWGNNTFGQLGNGTNNINSSVLVTVVDPADTTTALTGIASITTGFSLGGTTCAVMDDGTARCWGSNFYGQLGNGTVISSSVPVTVSDWG